MIAGTEDTRDTSETVDISVIPQAEESRRSSTLEQNRQKALQLLADATLLVQRVENNEQMIAIVDRLNAVRPELEAVIAHSSSSTNFELTAESQRESPGKAVVPQRRYLSTNKKRKGYEWQRIVSETADC